MNRTVTLATSTTTVCPVAERRLCINVSEREAQIKALVERKINALIKEHEKEISDENSFTRNYFCKEFTVEEYKRMISEAEERLYKVPSEYSTPYARAEYQRFVEREIELIKSDMQRMLDFEDYLRRVEEDLYKQYPLNMSQLIENVKSYIKTEILNYQKDITMEYHDRFINKVMNLCPKNGKDYSKRIEMIFKRKMSVKSMDTIYNFFKMLEYKLNVAVSMFNNYDGNEYDKLQMLLKSIVKKLIWHFHGVIVDFLIERIDCIDDEEMTDLNSVETYATYCIREMNSALLQELPDVLDNAMADRFEDIMEKLKAESEITLGFNISKDEAKASITYTDGSPDVEVVITKPQVSIKPKRDFTEFLKTIGNEPIVIEDLARLYNNYFGDNINTLSLSKRAEIRDHFNVKRTMRSGKKVRVYIKI